MSDVAALIADMVRAGVDPDLIGRTAALLAQTTVETVPLRSAAAVRQERYRRNKASRVTVCDAPSSPEVSPQTPLPNPSIHIPPSPPTGALPPQGAEPRSGRGQRIPGDFEPDLDWAVENGMRPEMALVEAAKFRDHWRSASGQTARKCDWPATWKNWVRRALERTPHRTARAPPRRETLIDALDRHFPRQEVRHDPNDHAGPTLEAG